MEQMLYLYVFPEFESPCGYMRARVSQRFRSSYCSSCSLTISNFQASWTLAHFAETKFQADEILMKAVTLIVNSLLTDAELRVKVQAAISLQELLLHQDKVQEYLRPQVCCEWQKKVNGTTSLID